MKKLAYPFSVFIRKFVRISPILMLQGVWTRTDNKVKVPVAIKILTEYTPAAQQEMLDEACIMARINHPHLVRLIGVCLSNQQTMLVAPLMPLGNLLEFIHVNKHMIGSAALLRWCMQIASVIVEN